jgi:ABC-type sugar transport system ATPase subunit
MSAEPIVRFECITKRFPGIVALNNVSLSIMKGACHGLVGENGAGKSTLGKVLAGIYPSDGGQVYVDGKPVRFSGPRAALDAGIGVVHQELSFCENMTVAENLCLERITSWGPFVARRRMYERARGLLAAIGSRIDVTKRLGGLSISQQQMVQIAAAVGCGARVIVFDEPTSSLSQHEAERLFDLIRKLQSQGVTSIYISHRMEEIFLLCDTISVLRDGMVVGTRPTKEFNEDSLVEMMIGRRLDEYFPEHLGAKPGEELLRVENLSSPGKFTDISFTLHTGEVLGFAGLVGAGRTEVAEAIFGLDPRVSGKIYLKGKQVNVNSASKAVSLGLGLLPEDRKRHGLVLMMSARNNLTLPILERLAWLSFVKSREERKVVDQFFNKLRVRARSMDSIVASLSGGNQQKVVIAKWLAAQCKVLMLDEPTRGVDVGAKAEIHSLVDHLAREGTGILMISSELPEVINLSTRILVLRNGKIAAEVTREKANQELLMRHMAGMSDSPC